MNLTAIKFTLLLFVLLFPGVRVSAGSLSLAVNAKGVVIESEVGQFILEAPNLTLKEDDYNGIKPQLSLKDSDTLVAKYPESDLEITITIDKENNAARYALSQVPTARNLRFFMLVPLKLNKNGTKFSFDDIAFQTLPSEKGSQFLFNGTAKRFRLVNDAGNGFSIAAPASWQGLQDNRLFNWDTYQYQFLYDLSYPREPHFSVTFESVTGQ